MSATPQHRPALAIVLILAGFASFSTMDMLVKLSTQSVPVEHVTFLRYAFHLIAVLGALPVVGLKGLLGGRRRNFLLLRGICFFASTILFFGAITELPLAEAAAISFMAPILTVGLSVLFLKEHVGIRRWSAVAVGFVGVMVILRPGMQELLPAHFMVLGTALCFSAFTLMTRNAGMDVPVPATLFYTGLTGTIGCVFLLPGTGDLPPPENWPLLVLVAGLALLAEICLIVGYRFAAASLLAPFQYSQMLWATLLGWAVFATLPDLWTCAGAVLIIGAGLYIWLRESWISAAPADHPASEPT